MSWLDIDFLISLNGLDERTFTYGRLIFLCNGKMALAMETKKQLERVMLHCITMHIYINTYHLMEKKIRGMGYRDDSLSTCVELSYDSVTHDRMWMHVNPGMQ